MLYGTTYYPSCTLNNSQSVPGGYNSITPGIYNLSCLTEDTSNPYTTTININATTTNNITINVTNAHVLLQLTFNKNTTGTIINYPSVNYSDFAGIAYYNASTGKLTVLQSLFSKDLVTINFNGNVTNQTKGQRYQYINKNTKVIDNLYVYTWNTALIGTNLDTYFTLKFTTAAQSSLSGVEVEVRKLENNQYKLTIS